MGSTNLVRLTRSLHDASMNLSKGLQRIEAKLPDMVDRMSMSEKLHALDVVTTVNQNKQLLVTDILGKLSVNGKGKEGKTSKGKDRSKGG
jgi:hypothetical protein